MPSAATCCEFERLLRAGRDCAGARLLPRRSAAGVPGRMGRGRAQLGWVRCTPARSFAATRPSRRQCRRPATARRRAPSTTVADRAQSKPAVVRERLLRPRVRQAPRSRGACDSTGWSRSPDWAASARRAWPWSGARGAQGFDDRRVRSAERMQRRRSHRRPHPQRAAHGSVAGGCAPPVVRLPRRAGRPAGARQFRAARRRRHGCRAGPARAAAAPALPRDIAPGPDVPGEHVLAIEPLPVPQAFHGRGRSRRDAEPRACSSIVPAAPAPTLR